jgi:hypothetical protein
MDSTGNFREYSLSKNLDLHFNKSSNQLRVFWDSAPILLLYNIVDASGRLMQKGRINPAELISIRNWKTAIYYLQLFSEDESYLDTKSFLKS